MSLSVTTVAPSLEEQHISEEKLEACTAALRKQFPNLENLFIDAFWSISWDIPVENGHIGVSLLSEQSSKKYSVDFYYYDDNFLEGDVICLNPNDDHGRLATIDDISISLQKDNRPWHEDEYINLSEAQTILWHPFTPEWETDPTKIHDAWYQAALARTPQYILDIIEDDQKALEVARLHPNFVEESVDELDEVSYAVKNAVPSWKAGWIDFSHWKKVVEEGKRKWLLK